MDRIFAYCVDVFEWIGDATGLGYIASNVWVFVILYPLVTIMFFLLWNPEKASIKIVKKVLFWIGVSILILLLAFYIVFLFNINIIKDIARSKFEFDQPINNSFYNSTFYYCVGILALIGKITGLGYNTANILIFVIFYPLITLLFFLGWRPEMDLMKIIKGFLLGVGVSILIVLFVFYIIGWKY